MRAGMIYYLKNNHANRFEKIHSRNGTLQFVDNEDLDDDGRPKWKKVNDPDGLHKILQDDLDIEKLNRGFRSDCRILKSLPLPEFPSLPEDELVTSSIA